MLKNRAYTGILRSGKSESDIIPELQIILPGVFETAQNLMLMRSKPKEERTVPFRIAGTALLAGNAYCGHCGARLTLTTSGKKRVDKNGVVTVVPRVRYVCYNKTRHKHLCDGQTGYTVSKLDAMMDTIIRSLFARLTDLPKDAIIEQKCAEQIAELQKAIAAAREVHQTHAEEVLTYEAEVLKVIRGESSLNADLLNKLHSEAKAKAEQAAVEVRRLEDRMKDTQRLQADLSGQFDNIVSWAQLYDECDMDTRKMIVANLCKAVRVKRDYEIEITLSVDCQQLGIVPEELKYADVPGATRQEAA